VGIDYGATRIFVDKREVSVHIFDTSGASLFTDVRNEFYREAHGLLMVMDVTRRESFEDLSDWVLEIKQELIREGRGLDSTVCFLAANKCDASQRSPLHTRVVHSHWSRIIQALLSLVDIMVLLCQLSYAIKAQLKAANAHIAGLWMP